MPADHRPVPTQLHVHGPFEGHEPLLGVLGDIHENGSGPTGRGDVERLRDDSGDVLGRGRHEGVLGHRHGHADDVSLLERVRAQNLGPHL